MSNAYRWAWALCLIVSCGPAPKPQPTPTPTVAPTPTPEPTMPPDECPAIDPARVRLPCGVHLERGDDQTVWNCTVKGDAGDYMPEGHPRRQECELKAMGGRPWYTLVGATGDLTLVPRDNPFLFNLKGRGSARLMCSVGAFDPCRAQVVSR